MKGVASTVPAPVGGLNDKDSLLNMKPRDAVFLENWWVYPSKVSVRKGALNWSTGYAAAIQTILEYAPTTPSGNKIFTIAGTSIYDATNSGVVGAAVVTGLTNARWEDAAITTPGGSFLYIVNGVDDPRLYDGTTWKAINAASTPAITGVVTNLLTNVVLFKNRLWFTERNSLRAWYLPTNSIGGAAAAFDLGSVFRLGGTLVGAYTWTLDAGSGSDDHLAFVSTTGEVVVYQGTDPTNVATFSLIGVYTIGKPIGKRCTVKYGGDLLVICEEGVYTLSKALLSATISRSESITDKIQNSISLAVAQYKANFGWQLCVYPEQNMLILNIPGAMPYQYAQNTITGAWTKFTGWTANVWRNTLSGLYYGDGSTLKKAWQGSGDQQPSGTLSVITADGCTSFQSFGAQAANKYFTMIRPYLAATGSPSILYALNYNYTLSDPTGALNFAPPNNGMVWGSMVWGTMKWGGSLLPIVGWNSVGGVASSAAVRLKVQNNYSDVDWSATDILYNKGGYL